MNNAGWITGRPLDLETCAFGREGAQFGVEVRDMPLDSRGGYCVRSFLRELIVRVECAEAASIEPGHLRLLDRLPVRDSDLDHGDNASLDACRASNCSIRKPRTACPFTD